MAGIPWWTTDIGGFHGGNPDDAVCWETEDEYFYGPDVLVAPILYAGQFSRTVYLPKGERWIDCTAGKEYEGGQTISAEAPLDTIPVFIKKGSNVFC